MKSLYKISLAALVSAAFLPAAAQNVNSGYFLENYLYRHQMNPAFGNYGKGYVGIPGLGNLNVGMHGNIHTTSIIYSQNGKSMLFTNPQISVDEAMDGFKNHNKLGFGMKMGIIDVGFKAFGGYNTIGINAVANADVSIPKAFFSLLKEGVSNQTYDISNLRADAVGYAEIALNHSRDIKQVPGLRVGATVKFLVGIAAFEAKMKEAYLKLGQDSWNIAADAEMYASIKGLEYEHDWNSKTQKNYVSGAKVDNFSAPNGFGLAFDLGAEYQWNDFRFSAAVLDLGYIRFSESRLASTNGLQEVRTDKYTFQVGTVDGVSAQEEWDNLADDFSALYQLNDEGNVGKTYSLRTTLNFGVDYELPVYRKIHFGLLNTTHINGPLSDTEFRLSANYEPAKWVSLNINGSAGTYGMGFGWMANLRTTGINFFLGMDHVPGKFSKQFIPLNSNADFFLGLDFPF